MKKSTSHDYEEFNFPNVWGKQTFKTTTLGIVKIRDHSPARSTLIMPEPLSWPNNNKRQQQTTKNTEYIGFTTAKRNINNKKVRLVLKFKLNIVWLAFMPTKEVSFQSACDDTDFKASLRVAENLGTKQNHEFGHVRYYSTHSSNHHNLGSTICFTIFQKNGLFK